MWDSIKLENGKGEISNRQNKRQTECIPWKLSFEFKIYIFFGSKISLNDVSFDFLLPRDFVHFSISSDIYSTLLTN